MTINPGPAKHLTILIDDGDSYKGRPVHQALMELFIEKNIAGATLFRGISGYGSDGVVHSSKLLRLTDSLPLRIDVFDLEEKIKAVLPAVCEIVTKGLVAVEDCTVVHSKFQK